MSDAHLDRISKLMSMILGHKPGQFTVLLDAEGYAPVYRKGGW
jgi:RNA:NAD 2'-phosphotransferase (TPT1/KptA family)